MDFCIGPIIAVVVTSAIAIVYVAWKSVRKRQLIHRWASGRGVRLLQYEQRRISRGPFSYMTTNRGQIVYRITVEHPDGRISTGWARCGSWRRGLFSSEVEVSWDKDEQEALGFPVILKKPQEPNDARE